VTKKTVFLVFVVAAVAAVGVPWMPAPEGDLSAPAPAARAVEPLKSLVTSHSALDGVYRAWAVRHARSGGDRSVVVRLGHADGLSTRPTQARGRAFLDLVDGAVRVEVEGLDGPADAWLIDDQDGPGGMLPEPGDRAVRVGRLAGGPRSVAYAALGPEFFRSFELDLVVVTPPGVHPERETLLFGGRPAFERIFTRTRLAAERHADERQRLRGFGLASLFAPAPAEADSTQILIAHDLIGQLVGDGGDLFFRGTFSGNGRTCGSCHPVENNQTIEPAFIATLPSSDPLFVAEFPAKKGGVPGLEIPALMRQFGLILENADGFQNPTVKFVMRGVPHSLSLATSITAITGFPQPQATGWSGDGSPDGTLNGFSTGAVIQHFTKDLRRRAGTDFRLPTFSELEAMEVFMLAVGRLDDLDLTAMTLASASADRGRRIFLNPGGPNGDPTVPAGKCNQCHLNAGANRNFGGGGNGNFDTGVEDVPHPARQVVNFPFDGGLGTVLNNEGTFGDKTFNSVGLVEAADTAPFFHNNVVTSLLGAVQFYSSSFFNNSDGGQAVGGINLNTDPTANADVTAFLRVINTAFNLEISVQRNEAAFTLENGSDFGGCAEGGGGEIGEECTGGGDSGKRATVDALLSLANAEGLDAVEVLQASALHPNAVTLIQAAIGHNEQAIEENASQVRKALIGQALQEFQDARALLGSGVGFTFDMGEGNLMF
jgi:hypothetical protein